jgi:hypothetical protein
MTVQRYLTKRLHDPGSDRALCSAPLPPPALDGGDNDDANWVARGLTWSSGDWSLVASTLRWSSALLSPWGGERGGGARRLAGFLAGVRRTKIEAGRYKAGRMRLSAGGRKRWAAASVAGTRTGSQGRGVSSGMAGDGDGRGPDNLAADAPPITFRRGGSLFPPPVDRRGAVDGDGSNGGDKKRKSNRSY